MSPAGMQERGTRSVHWVVKSIATYLILLITIWLIAVIVGSAIFSAVDWGDTFRAVAFFAVFDLLSIGIPSIPCIALLWFVRRRIDGLLFFIVAAIPMLLMVPAAYLWAYTYQSAMVEVFLGVQLSVQLLAAVAMTIYRPGRRPADTFGGSGGSSE